ncbi:MAG: IgGFc-binding protein, partial [Myxococcales bacterium]|nr:IgGFc-binding protein [Myxococcales bacterium]
TNFGDDLRAFLTIVGTRDDTTVSVALNTAIIGDGKQIPALKKGEVLQVKLNAFEVLNLETGGYGPDADFTGTRIDASKPVVVFSGSEASDVPDPPDLTTRRCCADHLEEQLFPTSTLGRTFIALTTPSRSEALAAAGASIKPNPKEMEFFRILSAGEFTAVSTNLPAPQDQLNIARGNYKRLDVDGDFLIQATEPVVVGQFVAGQQQAGIPSSLPGGDPSFILLPPVEQYRSDYLFLTPDKYAFDFITITAPAKATVLLDGEDVTSLRAGVVTSGPICSTLPADGLPTMPDDPPAEDVVHRCQFSFPDVSVDGQFVEVSPGEQNDGVHTILANKPVGIVIYGFDAFVSYAYAGGLNLDVIN